MKSQPKNATTFLCAIIRYKEATMNKQAIKAEIRKEWRGFKWSSDEMRQWALWQWADAGL
jgi:hypothetical protein